MTWCPALGLHLRVIQFFLAARGCSVNRVAKGLGVLAALLPLLAVPTGEAATVSAVPPLPSPATVLALSPFVFPGGTNYQLQGVLCQAGRTCVPVNVASQASQSVPGLDSAIDSTSGPVIVAGFSEGAQVAELWVRQHANDPDAPDPKNLTFVVMGNPTRAYGGSPGGEQWSASQYQVIDVARQYDFAADFPNNPSSPYFLLAVLNALAGGTGAHDYTGVNLTDPANTVFKVGNITYVLVPTPNLPLVGWLRQLGLTAQADQLQAQLKPLVEQAYNRNYPGIIQPGVITAQPVAAAITPGASTLSAPVVPNSTVPITGAPTSSASVVSDPTVASRNATVPLSLAPAPAAPTDLAPTPTGARTATGVTGRAVADTTTTTPPSDPADGLDMAKTITPPAAQSGLDKAVTARQSTAAPSARTTAAAATNGTKAVTGKADENSTTTNNGNRAKPAKDGKKPAPSNG